MKRKEKEMGMDGKRNKRSSVLSLALSPGSCWELRSCWELVSFCQSVKQRKNYKSDNTIVKISTPSALLMVSALDFNHFVRNCDLERTTEAFLTKKLQDGPARGVRMFAVAVKANIGRLRATCFKL